MHKHVETLIGRLATDRALRLRFVREPQQVIREQGLELSELECAALAAIDSRALCAFAATLDPRLQRALPAVGSSRDGES